MTKQLALLDVPEGGGRKVEMPDFSHWEKEVLCSSDQIRHRKEEFLDKIQVLIEAREWTRSDGRKTSCHEDFLKGKILEVFTLRNRTYAKCDGYWYEMTEE